MPCRPVGKVASSLDGAAGHGTGEEKPMIARAIVGALAVSACAAAAGAQTLEVVAEDTMVKSPDAGIELYVRNKRPAGMTSFRPERTVLYVHGATYPASTAFDLKLDGLSWMDYIAQRGYDVYLLDLR